MCSKNSKTVLILVAILGLGLTCSTQYQPDISKVSSAKGTHVYQPDPASLAKSYKIPEWFKDAKLGIF